MPKEFQNQKELESDTKEKIPVSDQIKDVILNHLEEEGLYDPENGKLGASNEEISRIVGELSAAGAISSVESLGIVESEEESRFTATVAMGGMLGTYVENGAVINRHTRRGYGKHVDPDTVKKNEELEEIAYIDDITGLPNKNTFKEASTLIEKVDGKENRKPSGGRVIVMIDINNFKAFNDDYKHAAGDVVLKYVGDELKRIVKQTLYADDDEFEARNVFRIHGDEYYVLCHPTEAALLKDRIISDFGSGERTDDLPQESLSGSVQLPSGQKLGLINWGGIPISVSAGIGETTLEADHAMYEMKPEVHDQFPEFVRKKEDPEPLQ